MGSLAAVVVTHNSERVAGPCLDALAACGVPAVVVDNASTDGTLGVVRGRPGVEVISNAVNRGFAAAVNQGVGATEAALVLILNPDVSAVRGVEVLAAEFRDAAVGAAAGLLTGESGEPQTGFTLRRFPTVAALTFELLGVNQLWPGNAVNRRYRCLDVDLERPQDAEQPAGAFLMVRREAWKGLGGFDEEFHPVWYEDVDFCLRLRRGGWKVRYNPGARAVHEGGHSVNALAPGSKALFWYGSLLQYAAKHYSKIDGYWLALMVMIGATLRTVAGMMTRFRFEWEPRVYGLAIRSLRTRRESSAPAPGITGEEQARR